MIQHCTFTGGSSGSIDLDCPSQQVMATTAASTSDFWAQVGKGDPLDSAFVVITGALIFLMIFAILFSSVKIADQWNRAVILRLGRFNRIAGPGLFFKVPIVDAIAEWVSLRTEVTEVKAENSLTKDTVPVSVTTIIYWKVVDPRAAVVNVDDYKAAIYKTAQVALREAVGSHDFSQLLSERESVDSVIRDSISRKTHDWGIEVASVDIRDVEIPANLQNAMSQEAQAERERHARVILGQSEKDIAAVFLEAAKIYEEDPVALQLRKMNILYETMKGEGNTMILLPTDIAEALGNLTNGRREK
jgi:regulator of protease activity HflC (stomatin/prohibitin superfamily)